VATHEYEVVPPLVVMQHSSVPPAMQRMTPHAIPLAVHVETPFDAGAHVSPLGQSAVLTHSRASPGPQLGVHSALATRPALTDPQQIPASHDAALEHPRVGPSSGPIPASWPSGTEASVEHADPVQGVPPEGCAFVEEHAATGDADRAARRPQVANLWSGRGMVRIETYHAVQPASGLGET
jgi:hypothetical protein